MVRIVYNPFTDNLDYEGGSGGGGTITAVNGQSSLVAPTITVTTTTGVATVEDRAWTTQYVVDPSSTPGLRGTFTTIQSAIDQAVTDGNSSASKIAVIAIRPATYSENLVMPASGICLKGGVFDGNNSLTTADVLINGTMTFTDGAIAYFQNLVISPSVTVDGSSTTARFDSCTFSSFVVNNGIVTCRNCEYLGSVFVVATASTCTFWDCNLTSDLNLSGGSTTLRYCNVGAIALSNSPNMTMIDCYCTGQITGSSGSTASIFNTTFLQNTPINFTGNVNYSGLNSTVGPNGGFFGTNTVPFLRGQTFGNIAQVKKTAVSYTVLDSDYYIGVTSTAAARTITLPDTSNPSLKAPKNAIFVIKDESGGAATNNITVATNGGTIDGASSKLIRTNYGSLSILFDGTNYYTIDEYAYETGNFTPTVVGATTAGTTTYTSQTGRYTKINNTVIVQAKIAVSNATGTGDALFGGLPYTISNTTNYDPVGTGLISSATWPWPASTTAPVFNGLINTTTGKMGVFGSATGGFLQVNNSAGTFQYTLIYRTT